MGRYEIKNDKNIIEKSINKNLDLAEVNYEIRFGGICPACKNGIFDYDGMLNLICPNCGYTAGGCFT